MDRQRKRRTALRSTTSRQLSTPFIRAISCSLACSAVLLAGTAQAEDTDETAATETSAQTETATAETPAQTETPTAETPTATETPAQTDAVTATETPTRTEAATTTETPTVAPSASATPSEQQTSGDFEGVSGFGGLGLGYGPTLHAYRFGGRGDLDGPESFTGYSFALQAGVFLNRAQLMLEWAPGTFQPLLKKESPHVDAGESFYSLVGSVGYYIPMTGIVSWPMRIGAGVGSERNDLIARLDLISVAVKLDSVLIEASLPSIRYMSDFDTYHRWTGLFGVSASYVYP